MEIVKANGLNPLLRILQSPDHDAILTAVSCIVNLTLQPTNDSPIIEAGFLQPLVALLAFKDNEGTQLYAAGALSNLAASSVMNKRAVVDAGAVQSIKELILEVSVNIQLEMTACIRNLSHSGMHSLFNRLLQSHPPTDELKGRLSEMGISEVLFPLTHSPNREVRLRSDATLQNLRNK